MLERARPRRRTSPHGRTRAAALLTLLLAGWASAQTPPDFGCMYRGSDDGARVFTRGGDYQTPYPHLSRDEDCRRLSVGAGEVWVYQPGPQGSVVTRKVQSGPLVRSADGQPGPLRQAWTDLKLILAGDQHLTQGSSRDGEAGDWVNLLPQGKLGPRTEALRLPLGPSAGKALKWFEVRVGGRTVSRQQGPADSLLIPARVLSPGQAVSWQLQHGDAVAQGQFTVTRAEEIQRVLSTPLSPPPADDTAEALQRASLLLEAGFRWDAFELLHTLQAAPR